MGASYYDIIEPIRYRVSELVTLQQSGKLKEMMSLLHGCGYSTKDTGLIFDAVQSVTQILIANKDSSR